MLVKLRTPLLSAALLATALCFGCKHNDDSSMKSSQQSQSGSGAGTAKPDESLPVRMPQAKPGGPATEPATTIPATESTVTPNPDAGADTTK